MINAQKKAVSPKVIKSWVSNRIAIAAASRQLSMRIRKDQGLPRRSPAGNVVQASEQGKQNRSGKTTARLFAIPRFLPAALAAGGFIAILSSTSALAGTCLNLEDHGTSTATGSGHVTPSQCGSWSVGIGAGYGAVADNGGVAVGDAAHSTGENSVAIGRRSGASATNSSALGEGAAASGVNATAIGNAAGATGTDSSALGRSANASGQNATAIGAGARGAADNATAVGAGARSTHENSVAIGTNSSTSVGAQSNYNAFGLAAPQSSSGEVSFGSSGSERKLTNIAAGSADTDAVNVRQLKALDANVQDNARQLGALGAEVQDNTRQLQVLNGNVQDNIDRLDALDAQTQNALLYDLDADGSRKNSITLQGGDPYAPVVISNVGRGVVGSDAVNLTQLEEGIADSRSYTDARVQYAVDYTNQVAANTLVESRAYTDQQVSQIGQKLDHGFAQMNAELGQVRNEARRAAAIGLAAASLRFDDRPGKLSLAFGGGLWKNQTALAFGAGYTSENGRVRANLTGTTASGQWGGGAGLSFTLN